MPLQDGHHVYAGAQTTAAFQVGLKDFYGHLSSATNAGTCQIASPSNDLLLTEQGRISSLQGGVATFGLFEVSGAATCVHACSPCAQWSPR